MGKKQVEPIHHYYYNWNKSVNQIFFWLIMLLVVTNVMGWVTTTVKVNELVYNSCVDGCSKKYFKDYEIGKSFSSETTITNPNSNRLRVYKPTIQEFDRTNCMANCNIMLLELRK